MDRKSSSLLKSKEMMMHSYVEAETPELLVSTSGSDETNIRQTIRVFENPNSMHNSTGRSNIRSSWLGLISFTAAMSMELDLLRSFMFLDLWMRSWCDADKNKESQVTREDGTDIVYINFGAMLKDISRDDLTELYRIVMNRYGMDGPEDELEKFTISTQYKNWLVQEQMALGKDFSNSFYG
ncbi:hypothetical protein Tco_0979652 [Tanacetum coccineum]